MSVYNSVHSLACYNLHILFINDSSWRRDNVIYSAELHTDRAAYLWQWTDELPDHACLSDGEAGDPSLSWQVAERYAVSNESSQNSMV